MKSVLLLSGGLDSATTLAIALKEHNREVYPLTIFYGQRHNRELHSSIELCKYFNLEAPQILNLPKLFGSSLTGFGEVPTEEVEGIPSTFVPARNIIFLSIAANYAISIGAKEIWIGANAVDYSGYPDCRPEFIDAFSQMLRIGTEKCVHIVTPIIGMTKAEIIKTGHQLGVDFSLTWSCYNGREKACGVCPSCRIRLAGFAEAGLSDSIQYEEVK